MNNGMGTTIFAIFSLLISVGGIFLCVIVNMNTEYNKNPDYTNSDIFAQGYMQKSTDCYGITTVKIGGRVINGYVTMPYSGGYIGVSLSNLCTDREYTIYTKSFWILGTVYTIR
jgi:hypothetical protein